MKITKNMYDDCKSFLEHNPKTGYCLERAVVDYYPLVEKGICRCTPKSIEYMKEMVKKYFRSLDYSI